MVVVNVRIDGLHQFQKSLRHTNAHFNKRCQQALNRTLQRSRTQMTNAIGEKLNLRKKTIRELISIQKANKNTGLIGKLTVKHKHVPLIEYNAKQNRKGVTFKMFKIRPRQLVKHAFIYADTRSKLTVFRRERGASRLKIKPLFGTAISNVAKDGIKVISEYSKNYFYSEINKLLDLACGAYAY
ncbi:MAG: hypothetical protein AB7I18_11140 [Candidatus Berkiella sp.]